jgi:hypothetical protein
MNAFRTCCVGLKNKVKLYLLLEDIQKLLQQEWEGMDHSLQMSQCMELSFLFSIFCVLEKHFIKKIVELHKLYTPHYVPFFALYNLRTIQFDWLVGFGIAFQRVLELFRALKIIAYAADIYVCVL